MAETTTQNPTTEQRRGSEGNITTRGSDRSGLARRHEGFGTSDLLSLNPFTMMRRLSDEMDRAFATTFGLSRGMSETGLWSPLIEVTDSGNGLEVTAELPGMNKNDVKLECTNEGLIIQGEKRHTGGSNEGGVYRSERTFGRFYRTIALPEGIDTNSAKAEFKDGVLTVRLPYTESHRSSRQIPISS